MTIAPAEGSMVLYQYLAKAWAWNDILVRLLALLMVVLMTFGVIQLFKKHHFSESPSYMPGVFLLLLLNCGKFLYTLTPAWATAFFIALIMVMYSPTEQGGNMKDRLFAFGMLIAVATFVDISAFGILLFLIVMIAFNNVASFRDILIMLLGLSFPYIWAFAIAFISNGTSDFIESWHHLSVFVPVKTFTSLRVIEYIAIAWFVIATIIFMVRDKKLLDNKLIVIRQSFNNINMLSITMLLFLWLGMVPLPNALLYLVLPVSLYMSMAVIKKRRWVLVDLLIVSMCVLLCL